jgi:hypothetical protein
MPRSRLVLPLLTLCHEKQVWSAKNPSPTGGFKPPHGPCVVGLLSFYRRGAEGTFSPMWQAHGGRDRFAVLTRFSGPNLLSNDTRSLGQGPLAALGWNANRMPVYAAKQACFAPHDLVSREAKFGRLRIHRRQAGLSPLTA